MVRSVAVSQERSEAQVVPVPEPDTWTSAVADDAGADLVRLCDVDVAPAIGPASPSSGGRRSVRAIVRDLQPVGSAVGDAAAVGTLAAGSSEALAMTRSSAKGRPLLSTVVSAGLEATERCAVGDRAAEEPIRSSALESSS